MADSFKIFTRKTPQSAHVQVEVFIDWSGISEEEMKILARNALIHNLHAEVAKSTGPIPEKVFICARAQVHKPAPAQEVYDPARLKKPTVTIDPKLKDALKGLSKDELKQLLGIV